MEYVLDCSVALESYDPVERTYTRRILFEQGGPCPSGNSHRFWVRGAFEGQRRLAVRLVGIKTGSGRVRRLCSSIVSPDGRLVEPEECRARLEIEPITDREKDFISAEPPVSLDRDRRRFLCTLRIDEEGMLRISIEDHYYDPPRIIFDHQVLANVGKRMD